MSYRVTAADPLITEDPYEREKLVANIAKNNAVTNQAQWDAFVAGISTLAQALAVCRGLLSSYKITP